MGFRPICSLFDIKFNLTVVLQLHVLFITLQVGLACVQLGKVLGCSVLGTAGTPDGMQLVVDNGASEVFNHREEGYADKIMVLKALYSLSWQTSL
jgi:D-arabinose 1-dehydrogenase-like Zn-dependent alcohol dehydrogenase